MDKSQKKTTPWVVKIPVAADGKSRGGGRKMQKQPEIYRDLAMALIGSLLEMRKAA